MKLLRTPAAAARHRNGNGCVAALAGYDGLHLGHQAILRELAAEAQRRDCPAVAFAFEPPPAEASASPPPRLTRLREKFKGLEAYPVDEFFCPRLTTAMRGMAPAELLRRLLVDTLAARHVVIGEDFDFAGSGAGTIQDLRAAGKHYGFGVTAVPVACLNGAVVNSAAIRNALAAGDLATARAMLGRDYMMSGRIVRGAQLGRKLGFPTANVPVQRHKSAVLGIFAVRVQLGDRHLEGVANVGTRPTVDNTGKTLLEVFIFDFDEDIYGEYIDVYFVERIRDELKFPDLDSMIEQMHDDVTRARALLAASR
jgi:riboflavin kinase/FMN adenylyltransferase